MNITNKFGSQVKRVKKIDDTAFIMRSNRGYFWIDKFYSIWSNRFFINKSEAERDYHNFL